ncbi:hypothetical protein [Mesorhizobium sp. NZP2077]|uniref:hypothetical protein n=1 Tax=Mesorhizobium sp. NZP2077 TaxID=2483404 RepID=UPI00155481BA|nr:hypothetical protein [Mesorhizobium sp. NZP2077]QKD17640.1 hypothetical protein HGP13_22805 [Mesorhizobium sp. NZP2077]
MTRPSEAEWGFEEIARDDPNRAIELAGCGQAEALIEALANTLSAALFNEVRIGFDGLKK